MGRTSKNIKLRTPEKPRKIKGFRSGSYRVATTISNQPRYDRFDTSPNPILLPVREQKSGRLPADTRYIIPHIREKSKSFFEKTGEI